MSEKKVQRYKIERHKWPDEIAAEKKKRRSTALIVFGAVALFTIGFLTGNTFRGDSTPGVISNGTTQFDDAKMNEIQKILKNEWYFAGEYGDNIDEDLINKALNGMVDNEWDPHTQYLSAEQMESFSSSLNGHFVGIGVQYYDMGKQTYVISNVFKNSPAEKAGVLRGDQIYKVDGKLTEEVEINEVSDWVKGEEGSNVKITVKREGKEIELDIKRESIASSVFYEIKDGVGILDVTSFADTTAEDTRDILNKFDDEGIKNIVIDLRNNGGGYLNTAQKMASLFVPSNSVTFQEKYSNGSTKDFKTNKDFKQHKYDNVVILINENSASASEVLTMSLQENIECSVVGVQSYGKGTMQSTKVFKDDSALKYTVGEWLSPSGKSINGVGITPDYEAKLDPALTTNASLVGDVEVKPDTVNEAAGTVQRNLKFLGYDVERTDSYFAPSTVEAIKKYQTDNGLSATGIVNDELLKALVSSANQKYQTNKDIYDVQMNKALEVANGR